MSWANRQVAAARRLTAAAGWHEDLDAYGWEPAGSWDAPSDQRVRLVFTGSEHTRGADRKLAWELHVGGRTEFVGKLEAAFVLAEIRRGGVS